MSAPAASPTDGPTAGANADARLALALLAADPRGLGGAVVKAAPGFERDAWLEGLRASLPPGTPWLRLPAAACTAEALTGGLDLAASLSTGKPVNRAGVLERAKGGFLVVPGAERLEPGAAAVIAGAADRGSLALVLLDEGGGDEAPPPSLPDRLAFRVGLQPERSSPSDLRARLEGVAFAAGVAVAPTLDPATIEADGASIAALCEAASALGVADHRTAWLALKAAKAAAALAGRTALAPEDLALAGRLVLAPRANRLPAAAGEPPPAPPAEAEATPPDPDSGGPAPDGGEPDGPDAGDPGEAPSERQPPAGGPLAETVVQAAASALPADLLERLQAGRGRGKGLAGRAGASKRSFERGRPVGAEPGSPGAGRRLDLIATLRAAVPFQTLRRQVDASGQTSRRPGGAQRGERGMIVAKQDLRLKRFARPAETVTVFAVDASGSAAAGRLNEAKGAVELLLARGYARRDRAALVAFRGARAKTLLEPTRALARAKRELAALPGGGGTPLASGIAAAAAWLGREAKDGRSGLIVFLTDGRANVALDGTGGRERAQAEALQAARALGVKLTALGARCLWLDVSPRRPGRGRPAPSPAAELATASNGAFLALPRADASGIERVVRAASPGVQA